MRRESTAYAYTIVDSPAGLLDLPAVGLQCVCVCLILQCLL
jgi:hypothetical protein